VPDDETVFHVADNPDAFGREHPADMALLGDIGATLSVAAATLSRLVDRHEIATRIAARARHKADHAAKIRADILADTGKPLTADAAVLAVIDALPEDCVIANDSAATFGPVQELITTWPGNYFFSRGGVLGCAMPAAVGVALATGGWVAALAGDGGAMYSPQALWSAAHVRARVLFYVFNNRRYGVLQNIARQLGCPNAVKGRFVGMDVVDPEIDFMALAAAMGVPAVRADDREAVAAATREALTRQGPSLIEIAVR
jgi:benzoylformate decarboxylase